MLSSSIVVFPPREPDPLLTRLLSVLCEECDVYYLSESNSQEVDYVKDEALLADLPSGVLLLTPSELHTVCAEDTIALVAHPYWLHVAASQTEVQLIMLQLEDIEEDPSGLFNTCTEQLRANSSLFCSRSEMKCLDATFRGIPALFLDEKQESLDLDLFIQAIHEIAEDLPVSAHEIQWTKRKAYYRAMREQQGPHETFSFFLSVYHYLLGEREALDYGEEAFLQAVASGQPQALISHYRFLSAIHAKLGNLQTAANIYGITAFGEIEARQYDSILSLLAQDQEELARAELLRLNDDYGAALSILLQLPADNRIRHLLFHMYRETSQWELALSQVQSSDLLAAEDRYQFRLLCGKAEAVRGERHSAIRLFLEAAAEKEEALVHIAALEVLDEQVQTLLKGS